LKKKSLVFEIFCKKWRIIKKQNKKPKEYKKTKYFRPEKKIFAHKKTLNFQSKEIFFSQNNKITSTF